MRGISLPGLVYLLNLASVGIFGMILSAAFCDILWTRQRRLAITGSMAAILMLQGIVYFLIDPGAVERIYPLITHFPLTVVLCILSGKVLWPTVSVLTAYLCCQLRRWLALLVTAVFAGDSVMENTVELVMTLPLLFLLLRFIVPSVRSVAHSSTLVQCQFGLVPALYYGFDYLTRIYTSLLLDGNLVAIEFMPFVCSVAYLMFVVRVSAEGRIRSRLEQTQDILNLQIAQAVREIEALRKSWEKTRTYRHDLRHHMQYLLSCIENGRYGQAQEYIHEICSEIEANQVTAFCENEAANLIFSAFAGKTESQGIQIKIRAQIPQAIDVAESDLCVLLSNALENALHSCQKRKEKEKSGVIEVCAYEKKEKKGKIFLQIINSCDEGIRFEHGLPVAREPGHGMGVRSICAVVERYGGIYSFSAEGEKFILRILV